MSDELELSRQLTTVVSTTPGVVEVYPAGSLAQTVVQNLVNIVADDEIPDAKVAVSRAASGVLTVTATIGVAAAHPVPDTLRAVSDAVRQYLDAFDPQDQAPLIDVKVSHIDNGVLLN